MNPILAPLRWRCVFCALFALLPLAGVFCPLLGQTDWPAGSDPFETKKTASLRGEIVLDAGIFGDRLVVELQGLMDRMGTRRATPTATGAFDFDFVPIGEYELRVTDLYGRVISQQFVTVADQINFVRLELPRREGDKPISGTVSLAQLQRKIPPKAKNEFKKAEEAEEKGRTQKSIEHLEKAIEIAPDYMEAYNNLGVRYIRLGEYSRAAEYLEKAAELDPGAPTVFGNLAAAYFALQRWADTEQAARRALQYDPSASNVRYLLGVSLVAQHGLKDEAVDSLRNAAQGYPKAYLALAEFFAGQGARSEAVAELRKYLESGAGENREEVEKRIAELEAGR